MPKAGQHSAIGAAMAITWHASQHHAIDRRSLRSIDDSVYPNEDRKYVGKLRPIYWIRGRAPVRFGSARQRAGLDVDHRRERFLRLQLPAAEVCGLHRMGISE